MVRLRVREIAESQGWNAAKLARRADLSNNAVYGIWNGETTDPGLLTLVAIARALGVKLCDLVDEGSADLPARGIIEGNIKRPVLVPA